MQQQQQQQQHKSLCFLRFFRVVFWLKSYENHTRLTLLTLSDLHAVR